MFEAVLPTHHHLAALDRELHPITAFQTKTLTDFWRHSDSPSTANFENRRHFNLLSFKYNFIKIHHMEFSNCGWRRGSILVLVASLSHGSHTRVGEEGRHMSNG